MLVTNPIPKTAEEDLPEEIKPVISLASESDLDQARQNELDAKEAYGITKEKINEHGLVMKLVQVEYTLDRSKMIFYFTADGRVDFRELVKD